MAAVSLVAGDKRACANRICLQSRNFCQA